MLIEKVENVLRESKNARNDDYFLYARIITKYYPTYKHIELVEAFKNHQKYELPSFKSVERARQKLQVKYPDLKNS